MYCINNIHTLITEINILLTAKGTAYGLGKTGGYGELLVFLLSYIVKCIFPNILNTLRFCMFLNLQMHVILMQFITAAVRQTPFITTFISFHPYYIKTFSKIRSIGHDL